MASVRRLGRTGYACSSVDLNRLHKFFQIPLLALGETNTTATNGIGRPLCLRLCTLRAHSHLFPGRSLVTSFPLLEPRFIRVFHLDLETYVHKIKLAPVKTYEHSTVT
jgi:hypothetical protein